MPARGLQDLLPFVSNNYHCTIRCGAQDQWPMLVTGAADWLLSDCYDDLISQIMRAVRKILPSRSTKMRRKLR